MIIDCLGHPLNLNSPQIMGVLNVTPDSFSDGGRFTTTQKAVRQAEKMIDAGVAIIDVGGESTRPGAKQVDEKEELSRVIPVIEKLRAKYSGIISIDTSKPTVMREAVSAGANLINDVYALRAPKALEIVASLNVPVCLMHMQQNPGSMQHNPQYKNVLDELKAFFEERILSCDKAGIAKNKIILDPGFGFGKLLEHNLRVLKQLDFFKCFDLPILVGLSRKSMLGEILDSPVQQRLVASVSAALIAVMNGASIVRVHDVSETLDAIKIFNAVFQVDCVN